MHVSDALPNGLLIGCVYGLMAAGLGLGWKATRTLNLAYGGLVMLGSYVSFELARRLGVDPLVALPLSAMALGVLGWLLQRLLLNRLTQAQPLQRSLATFALLLILIQAAVLAFGGGTRALPGRYLAIVGGSLSSGRLVQAGLALAALGALAALLGWTRWGQAIRATSLDEWVAFELGVDTARVQALVGGISGAVAGAAGGLLMLTEPLSPGNGGVDTLAAFVACALLGPGDVPGALAGGLALGLALTLIEATAGPGWSDLAAMALLLAVLLIRWPLVASRPVPEPA